MSGLNHRLPDGMPPASIKDAPPPSPDGSCPIIVDPSLALIIPEGWQWSGMSSCRGWQPMMAPLPGCEEKGMTWFRWCRPRARAQPPATGWDASGIDRGCYSAIAGWIVSDHRRSIACPHHPGGMKGGSRWLSEATPPENHRKTTGKIPTPFASWRDAIRGAGLNFNRGSVD
jgi:hypothetical protein